jgi:glyoxylase-like metal-dependent hydrolase (beta-lactamase superfamily II)
MNSIREEFFMQIKDFYHPQTFTVTYIIYDETKKAAIIDPVLDYDPKSSMIAYKSPNDYIDFIEENGLELEYIYETHAHADHLSSSQYLKRKYPKAKVSISENITKVQEVFKGLFNFKNKTIDGSDFDHLYKDGEVMKIGNMEVKVIETPGHTPACASLLVNNEAVFTGDALFIEDFGTGRCDFPAGSAEDLYQSIHEKLYNLDDNVKVYVGHDYQPNGRALRYETTIGESKKSNVQLTAETSKDDFVSFRQKRDSGLAAPVLIFQSVQFNAWAGKMPDEEDNGMGYFKMPVRIRE